MCVCWGRGWTSGHDKEIFDAASAFVSEILASRGDGERGGDESKSTGTKKRRRTK